MLISQSALSPEERERASLLDAIACSSENDRRPKPSAGERICLIGLLRRVHITHSLRSLVYDPENLTTNLDAPEIQVLIVVRQVNDRMQSLDSPSLFRSWSPNLSALEGIFSSNT